MMDITQLVITLNLYIPVADLGGFKVSMEPPLKVRVGMHHISFKSGQVENTISRDGGSEVLIGVLSASEILKVPI